MQIQQVDFIDIPSRDLERSIEFYRDVLELPQNPREPTEFEAGNVTLAVWKPEDQGVEFIGERDSGVCNMAFFTDPDGNSLILHRRYAP